MDQDTDPPQHLLGGLNVVLLLAPGSDAAQAGAASQALEEMGVNVLRAAPARGPVPASGPGTLEASQPVAHLAADAVDGVLVIADGAGAQALAQDPQARAFLAGVNAAGKPIAAIGAGVLPVLTSGAAQSRVVSAPPQLTPQVKAGSAVASAQALSVDANLVSAPDGQGLADFIGRLKRMLADRRRATLTPGNDTPSAVGEDG